MCTVVVQTGSERGCMGLGPSLLWPNVQTTTTTTHEVQHRKIGTNNINASIDLRASWISKQFNNAVSCTTEDNS